MSCYDGAFSPASSLGRTLHGYAPPAHGLHAVQSLVQISDPTNYRLLTAFRVCQLIICNCGREHVSTFFIRPYPALP